MESKDYSRRKFLNKVLGTGSALLGSALFLNSCNTNESSGKEGEDNKAGETKKQSTSEDPCNDLSGVSEGELKKRQSLGYVTKSPDPENYCGNCALYIPPAKEGDCGGCLLFKGPVKAEGHCVQWAAKTS